MAAAFLYHNQILQPDATDIRVIKARLHCYHLAAL
jgi:hypothetical protein